jgi:predicted metal-dependent hydrolase
MSLGFGAQPDRSPSLPAYSVRESQRAKNVNLRLSPTGKLEVVVPIGFDRSEIPAIIIKHTAWLRKARERIASRQPEAAHLVKAELPSLIELRALNQNWLVEYTPASVTHIRISELDESVLILWGNTPKEPLCHTALQRWLTQRAHKQLSPWIRRLSEDINLPFGKVSFRGQKTLWGSCSTKKDISLNYKLLFLPAPMVNYVFIHELAHTIHMDHSANFWQLVGHYEPDYRQLDRDLNNAMKYIPRWLSEA